MALYDDAKSVLTSMKKSFIAGPSRVDESFLIDESDRRLANLADELQDPILERE